MADNLLGIGQFSRLSGLIIKALRYYDRIGLLRPAVVDEATGFRFYEPAQVDTARRVSLLRSVDLPMDEVKVCLESADASVERELLTAHLARLQSRAARSAGRIHRLYHLLDSQGEMHMPPKTSLDEILTAEDEREVAKRLFNHTWELLEKEERTPEEDDELLHSAHASACHWRRVGKPENFARGEWQCSRVYAVLGRPEPCRHHARRVLEICELYGIGDFDLAFAYEALARAAAVACEPEEARAMVEKALAASDAISDPEDRDILLADLETVPGVERFW